MAGRGPKTESAPEDALELVRSGQDRHLYVLDHGGSLQFARGWGGRAVLTVGGQSWQLSHTGRFRQGMHAVDGSGEIVGVYRPTGVLGRNGTVTWYGRDLQLRSLSSWRHRHLLSEGKQALAVLEAKSWGRTPIRISLSGADAQRDQALLLFVAFVLRSLASSTDSTGGAIAATIASTG